MTSPRCLRRSAAGTRRRLAGFWLGAASDASLLPCEPAPHDPIRNQPTHPHRRTRTTLRPLPPNTSPRLTARPGHHRVMSDAMSTERLVAWDGLINGRDLGGLATPSGPIQRRRIVRSASTQTLTALGWQQLAHDGISSIVDLRHDDEVKRQPIRHHLDALSLNYVHSSLEPDGYVDSWSGRGEGWKLGTPLYYPDFAERHGSRIVAVLGEIANAPTGGVVVHCSAGRDRAGLVVATLLDLLGVDHDTIVSDHWLSFDRPTPIEVEMGKAPTFEHAPLSRNDHADGLRSFLHQHPATALFASEKSAAATTRRLVDRLIIAES